VESQFDVQDSATRDECGAAGRVQVQHPAVSNRKTTEKGEHHAKRKIDKAPIFAFVGFWRDSSAAVIIAEMGVDTSVFASVSQLASWAGLCPGITNLQASAKAAASRQAMCI
jgi:hypothetical protein